MKDVLNEIREIYNEWDMFYWKTFFKLKDLIKELEKNENDNSDSRSVERFETGLPSISSAGTGFIRRVDRK